MNDLLSKTDLLSNEKIQADVKLQHEILLCLKAILGIEIGMIKFIQEKDAINNLALLLKSTSITCSIVCTLLGFICLYSDDGQKLVLASMNYHKLVSREKKRFSTIIDRLEAEKDNQLLVTSIFILFNSLLSTTDSTNRSIIQREIIDLGMGKIAKEIQMNYFDLSSELKEQLQVFDKEMEEFQLNMKEFGDPEKITKFIYANLSGTDASQCFLNILQFLYFQSQNAYKDQSNIEYWKSLNDIIGKSIKKDNSEILTPNELKLKDQIDKITSNLTNEKSFKNVLLSHLKLWSEQKKDEFQGDFDKEYINEAKEYFEVISKLKKSFNEQKNAHEKEILSLQKKINIMNEKNLSSSQEIETPKELNNSQEFKKEVKKEENVTEEKKEETKVPPPPIMKIGAPPPPMMKIDLPSLPSLKPEKPIKTFHCDDIVQSKIQKSIFYKNKIIENVRYVEMDTKEQKRIQDLFSTKKSVIKIQKQEKEKIISLIDSNRSYNISILLKSINMKNDTIVSGILELDDDFDVDTISALIKVAPTPEEIEIVSRYTGDINQLTDADRFFISMKSIPNLKQRLECWYFERTILKTILNNLIPDVKILIEACNEVKNSVQFSKVLEIILAFANYMGGKKSIYGIKISSLSKLKDTKTYDNKSNLLQYIADYIERKKKDLLKFGDDLIQVKRASGVNLDVITSQIKVIESGLKQLESQIMFYQLNPLEDDVFVEKMETFKEKLIFNLGDLKNYYQKMMDLLKEISELYDEDKLLEKPQNFFSYINNFIDSFEDALKMKRQAELEEEKKQSRQNTTLEDEKLKKISINLGNIGKIMEKKRLARENQ